MHRLLTALAPLVPGRNQRGRIVQAQMLYRFFAHEALTARNLADAANVERVAGGRATAGLVHAGLLQWTYEGPRRVYRLLLGRGLAAGHRAGRGAVGPARGVAIARRCLYSAIGLSPL
jgi:hypothetical protein